MLTVWIGYDKQFDENTNVQLQSIKKFSSIPVEVKYLKLEELPLTRTRDPLQSTDSAFTRWLVPYLANYEGWHLYMDSDMMVRHDLMELWKLRDESKSVSVVMHPNYTLEDIKFNSKPQSKYRRKNWSSLMLFNAKHCKTLTLDYVNTASGLDLHQFKWIDDDVIGELPKEWNHLVGCEPPNINACIVHWTLGGPWFSDFNSVEYADEWRNYTSDNSLKLI
jgi:lipopolysaccharide biosynthesis glycosyltransferase